MRRLVATVDAPESETLWVKSVSDVALFTGAAVPRHVRDINDLPM